MVRMERSLAGHVRRPEAGVKSSLTTFPERERV
jgi:hypothetical protein